MKHNIKLIIDDCEENFEGCSFGAHTEVRGEIVFNTSMVGYVEALTDPSYKGQILVLTYPLQGNYGIPKSLHESPRIQVAGLVVSSHCENPNHHTNHNFLHSWLKAEGVPAISSVDTRAITAYLREKGTHFGNLSFFNGEQVQINRTNPIKNVLDLVAPLKTLRYGNSPTKILVIDTGTKENIIRSLLNRCCSVIRAPWNSNWEVFLPEVDGILLTNGPGNPEDASDLVSRVKNLFDLNIPIFGICLGHQLLSLAAGAKINKMKYGHRSVNQPVKSLLTGRCYITSQNHGYDVITSTLQNNWKPLFKNINDGTNEGIYHLNKPIFSVQFHPEASPGPTDTAFLFDDFIETVLKHKTKQKPNALSLGLEEGKTL